MFCQVQTHTPRRGRCPTCPAERGSASFGELPLARPDEDVWAYVDRASVVI